MLCKQSFILSESQLYLYYSLLVLVSVLLIVKFTLVSLNEKEFIPEY